MERANVRCVSRCGREMSTQPHYRTAFWNTLRNDAVARAIREPLLPRNVDSTASLRNVSRTLRNDA
eukprot:7347071-Lingulodinium_polyedra.AAC.1